MDRDRYIGENCGDSNLFLPRVLIFRESLGRTGGCSVCSVTLLVEFTRSTAMAVDGAARRRRERRLRGHWKHKCLSVRMAVAAAMHHSSGKRVVATAEVAVQTEHAPVTEHVIQHLITPTRHQRPVIEYVHPAPTVTHAAPVPVIEQS